MYVVLDRALPFLGDGLKPVQRRIIYAMSELGLNAGAKPKKSARTVGDVIGKFHPHGDSACYEALVLMAQPFSYRYPLIEGQGNFGSSDDPEVVRGDALHRVQTDADRRSAARRARRRARSNGRRTSTARWKNRTGCRRDCRTCCSTAPPASRSAWRPMSRRTTSTRSSAPACACSTIPRPTRARPVRARARPGLSDRSGNHHAVSRPARDVRDRPRQRACARDVRARAGEHRRSPPCRYQVSPSKVIEQIAAQMRAKKLPWLEDLRDESDHDNPTRIVLIPRSNRIDADQLMGHLFATTDLETQLSRQHERHRRRRPAAGQEPAHAAVGMAGVPLRNGDAATAASPGEGRTPPAHAGRLAGRVPQPRRSHPHHPHRGRAEAGADRALRAQRGPGRLHPRDQAASSSPGWRK